MQSDTEVLIAFFFYIVLMAWFFFYLEDQDPSDAEAPSRHFVTSIIGGVILFGSSLVAARLSLPADFGRLIAIGLLIYFVPWLIAVWRGHHNTLAIFALNLLLGWTFLGWVAAVVWACTQVKASPASFSDGEVASPPVPQQIESPGPSIEVEGEPQNLLVSRTFFWVAILLGSTLGVGYMIWTS
jgi:hypothetical protein